LIVLSDLCLIELVGQSICMIGLYWSVFYKAGSL